jgi:hypothetical protein
MGVEAAAAPQPKPKPSATSAPNVDWDEAMQRQKLIEYDCRRVKIKRELNQTFHDDPSKYLICICNAYAALAEELEPEIPSDLREEFTRYLLGLFAVNVFVFERTGRAPFWQKGELHPHLQPLLDEAGHLSDAGTRIRDLFLRIYPLMRLLNAELEPDTLEESFKGKPKELQEVYLQTMRERFYLEETTVALKKRFLAEEQIRLDHDYYAPELVPALQQLQKKLLINAEKEESDYSSSPGLERDKLLGEDLAPLASMQAIDKVMAMVGHMGLYGFPYKYEPLTPTQEKAMELLLKEGLRGMHAPDILSFLEGLRMDAEEHANTWWTWAQSDPCLKGVYGKISDTQAWALRELVILFEWNHVYLTRLCNILSRRVRGPEHQELPFRAANLINKDMPDLFQKKNPESGLAIFPQYKTVGVLAYEQALAKKNTTPPLAGQPSQQAPTGDAAPQPGVIQTPSERRESLIGIVKSRLAQNAAGVWIEEDNLTKSFKEECEADLREAFEYFADELDLTPDKINKMDFKKLLKIAKSSKLFQSTVGAVPEPSSGKASPEQRDERIHRIKQTIADVRESLADPDRMLWGKKTVNLLKDKEVQEIVASQLREDLSHFADDLGTTTKKIKKMNLAQLLTLAESSKLFQ